MSPYTLHVLVGWVRSSKGDDNDSFTTWIAKKWKVYVIEVDIFLFQTREKIIGGFLS